MTYITMSIDIDDALEQIDDEDIKREYEERNLGLGSGTETWDEMEELQKAYLDHHAGRRDKAYEILWKMCLVRLNKIV
jgi:hypothetical protein